MMTGFERYTKKTRRAAFLEGLEQVALWRKLGVLIEPHYPKAGGGRPPIGSERMLRKYFGQRWLNLSDPAVEEALVRFGTGKNFPAGLIKRDFCQQPVENCRT